MLAVFLCPIKLVATFNHIFWKIYVWPILRLCIHFLKNKKTRNSTKSKGNMSLEGDDSQEDYGLSENEANDNLEESTFNSFRNLPLKDNSGLMTIRRQRKSIRYCK